MPKESPTTILFLIDQLSRYGGAERQLLELIDRFDPLEFTAIVCGIGGPPLPAATFWPELKRRNITIEILKRNHSTDPKRLIALLGILDKYRPQILHTYLEGSMRYGAMAGSLAQVPVTIVGQRSLGGQGGYISRIAEKISLRLVDGVVSNSETNAGRLSGSRLVPDARSYIIPNGLDLDIFDEKSMAALSREETGIPDGVLVLGMVATFNKHKNHPMMFRALQRLGAASFAVEIHLALVGDGERTHELESLAQNLGIAHLVHFLGRRNDVPALWPLFDISVLASHVEGMPNSVMEAMAAGKPVVATDVGGTKEVVKHGQTGWLVAEDDDSDLAERLAQLIADPKLRQRFGEAGRRRIQDRFSMQAMVSATVDLYDTLLRRKGLRGIGRLR